MSLLSRIADRLIIKPTTHKIDTEDREQKWISTATGKVEAWVVRTPRDQPSTKIVMLKFPGAGGRAERAREYPTHLWKSIESEVWTINHRGYGGSDGPGTIQNMAETCEGVWKAAREDFPDRKIVLYGNSLGCLSALYLAARYPAAGIFLRNPPPLAQMIATRRRYTWWSFGFSKLIAKQVPIELDSTKNAGRSTAPALFVCAEKDTVVPPSFQDRIISAYHGEHRCFIIEGADHHHRIPEKQESDYVELLLWLESAICSGD